jgi:hypothetical protein
MFRRCRSPATIQAGPSGRPLSRQSARSSHTLQGLDQRQLLGFDLDIPVFASEPPDLPVRLGRGASATSDATIFSSRSSTATATS